MRYCGAISGNCAYKLGTAGKLGPGVSGNVHALKGHCVWFSAVILIHKSKLNQWTNYLKLSQATLMNGVSQGLDKVTTLEGCKITHVEFGALTGPLTQTVVNISVLSTPPTLWNALDEHDEQKQLSFNQIIWWFNHNNCVVSFLSGSLTACKYNFLVTVFSSTPAII